MNIDYIHEPTDLQCGQAVLAMLLGTTAEYICQYLDNDRETDLREMKRVLTEHGIGFSPQRRQAHTAADLPRCALLSLETPRCWHWSLYADGTFYVIFLSQTESFTGRYFPRLSCQNALRIIIWRKRYAGDRSI